MTNLPPFALRRGKRHPAVAALRARLAAEGFGAEHEPSPDPERLDGELWRRLKRYQLARGLKPTGRVDGPTREVLAQPPEHWLRRLELGLARWHVGDAREAAHLRVNIPQYEVQLVEEGEVAERYPAVVGKTYWRTPVTLIEMGWIFLRPAWFGRGEAAPVPPGPNNPLGPLVIRGADLSNLIYLHGTNRPELFRHPYRTYSRGCIRLQDPAALAARLLDADADGDGSEVLRRRMQAGSSARLRLVDPVPAWFVYNTTFAAADGDAMHFTRDVYGLDEPLLRAAATRPLAAMSWHAARRSHPPLRGDDLAGPAQTDVVVERDEE